LRLLGIVLGCLALEVRICLPISSASSAAKQSARFHLPGGQNTRSKSKDKDAGFRTPHPAPGAAAPDPAARALRAPFVPLRTVAATHRARQKKGARCIRVTFLALYPICKAEEWKTARLPPKRRTRQGNQADPLRFAINVHN